MTQLRASRPVTTPIRAPRLMISVIPTAKSLKTNFLVDDVKCKAQTRVSLDFTCTKLIQETAEVKTNPLWRYSNSDDKNLNLVILTSAGMHFPKHIT